MAALSEVPSTIQDRGTVIRCAVVTIASQTDTLRSHTAIQIDRSINPTVGVERLGMAEIVGPGLHRAGHPRLCLG